MEVFLSWSGQRSKLVADALRSWLPCVLQSVKPWVSGTDIEAGARWHQELTTRLAKCNFGVICLTPENLESPWLLYEAGALSKSVEGSSVVPFLFGVRKADVEGPLAHFQKAEADIEGTRFLLNSMNAVLGRLGETAPSDHILNEAFELWWPQLERHLKSALSQPASSEPPAARSADDMIRELVEVSRGMSGAIANLTARMESSTRIAPVRPVETIPLSRPLHAQPEIVDAARKVLADLIAAVEGDVQTLNNDRMSESVERWKLLVNDRDAAFLALNDAIADAKNLEGYINR
jgi:hypothetical protein